MERLSSGEACGAAQVFLDAQQLVVLRRSIGARQRSGLDLPGISCDGQICDEWILRFAGAMRDDRRATMSVRELDAIQCLRKRADLIDLDKNRVCNTEVDSFL